MPGPDPTEPRGVTGPVVVAGGHLVDSPSRPAARFPPSAEPAVAAAEGRVLDRWGVGPGALVVTGGARGADIVAAAQALARDADVWLLLALPEEAFVETSVEAAGTDWGDRFRRLRRRCPTWVLAEEPPEGPVAAGGTFARAADWMLRVARAQAGAAQVRVLAVWDGEPGDGPGGTAHLVELARRSGAVVEVVSPRGPGPG